MGIDPSGHSRNCNRAYFRTGFKLRDQLFASWSTSIFHPIMQYTPTVGAVQSGHVTCFQLCHSIVLFTLSYDVVGKDHLIFMDFLTN